MNHNEDVPDFLGGLGDMLPADVLKKVNDLLEQLHRKDKDHQGSKIEFVYVAPGAQHVETVQNQYLYPAPSPAPYRGGEGTVGGKPAYDRSGESTAVTMPSIDERAAYAHYHEHRPHIASFCGTGNIAQKLSAVYLGRAFVDLGFQRVKSNGQRGYIVVQRTAAEIQETQRAMAAEAESG